MTVGHIVIGEATDADGLIELYRQRKDELGLTNEWFDEYSGLARGHVGKLLGDARAKNLGATTIHAMNCSLAVKFVMVVDVEQAAVMQPRWEKRERPLQAMLNRLSMRAFERAKPHVMREVGRAGGKASASARMSKLTKAKRSKIARKAARARWHGTQPIEAQQ